MCRGLPVTTDPQLQQTLKHLYEGVHHPLGIPLADAVIFRDPVVVVCGRPQVLRMFSRLNRLFPASSMEAFDRLDASPEAYELLMHYRRHRDSKAQLFKTRLVIEQRDGAIQSVEEHWISPIKVSAKTNSMVLKWIQRRLGRILS